MRTLPELKADLQFNRELHSLLEVLKGVATAQFFSMQQQFRTFDAFTQEIKKLLSNLNPDDIAHPFVRSSAAPGIVAVTTDAGMVGGLNRQVMNMAFERMEKKSELVVVGERGVKLAREQNISCTPFAGIRDDNRASLAEKIRDYLLARVLAGSMGGVLLIHPVATSFSARHTQRSVLLPCTECFESQPAPTVSWREVLYESPPARVVEYVAYLWVWRMLFDAFGQSQLAEYSARSMHLEGGTQELQREGEKIKLKFNRARRELIDRGMRELFATRITSGNF